MSLGEEVARGKWVKGVVRHDCGQGGGGGGPTVDHYGGGGCMCGEYVRVGVIPARGSRVQLRLSRRRQ